MKHKKLSALLLTVVLFISSSISVLATIDVHTQIDEAAEYELYIDALYKEDPVAAYRVIVDKLHEEYADQFEELDMEVIRKDTPDSIRRMMPMLTPEEYEANEREVIEFCIRENRKTKEYFEQMGVNREDLM